MIVDVAQQDINAGEKDCLRNCPIARALTRQTDEPWMVTRLYAWPMHRPDEVHALPVLATLFVDVFDERVWCPTKLRPFTFELETLCK